MKQRSTDRLRSAYLIRAYKKNRGLILNASFLLMIISTFVSATNTKNVNKVKHKTEEKDKAKGRITKQDTRRLVTAAIPHLKNRAIGYLGTHIILLFMRAYLTLWVANLDGKLVASLISKRLKLFGKLLSLWMLLGVPASLVNSLLTWTKSNLRKSLRTNITDSIMEDYLPDNLDPNFYALIQLSDSKITDADQRISTDISRLAEALSSLPGQLLKPTLDLALCGGQLATSGVGSGEGALLLGLVIQVSTIVLRLFTPPFAKLASERAKLEGQLRSAESKVVSNNEEIAFLRGHERELDYLDYCYYQLERFSRHEYWKKAIHEVSQTFIVKYFWGALGLLLCSAPVFIGKYMGNQPDPSVAGDFITNRRLLLSASDSLDRLIYSRKYILQVIGHASRVAEFQRALKHLSNNKDHELKDSPKNNVSYGNEITFQNVLLETPAKVALIEKLNFSIKHGQNLLIAGPNGSGKSSLFRMLGGLWPCTKGHLTIPKSENMFYIPQRAYLCKGTLREQITYPHTHEQYLSNIHGKTDDDLKAILDVLQLNDLLVDSNSLNEVKNWADELSIGAQQRLAMARLFYHQPKFAVLDECTSAVSPEMEQFMYEHAQKLGISLLSVAHRPALWHFHDYLLKFDGKGGYYFGKLDADRRLRFEEERLALEKNLRNVPSLKERLRELEKVSNAQHIRYTNSHKNLSKMGSVA